MKTSLVLLFGHLWGISGVASGVGIGKGPWWNQRATPYLQHYKDVLHASLIDNVRAEQLIQIVNLIRSRNLQECSLQELVAHVRAQRLAWLQPFSNDDTILHVLSLAIKLWLFTTVHLKSCGNTLPESIAASFLRFFSNESQDDMHRLSDDFCAKNLERRGGFRIHWTSELAEHLTCVDKKVIRVFRHHSAIQAYLNHDNGLEKSLLPDELLSELDRTFFLLFPYAGDKAAKRASRESRKRQVDLVESWADDAVGEFARLQLQTYPRFRNRLAEIQRRYDAVTPSNPRQWWYDRRQRMEWAALMIAILVLLLTVVTLATSILQVYAAFQH